jgi:hypothetical protein
MNVSISIILDELNGMKMENYVDPGLRHGFDRCMPLPDDGSELSSSCLYVGGLSAALRANRPGYDAVVICQRDRVKDCAEIGFGLRGLIIINENIPPEQLLSLIQRRFWDVVNWKSRFDEALLSGCTMQDLVDMCPPILKNHIQITDASFMKLAQSTKVQCDCPICVKLKKFGYHPEEVVQEFRRHDLFSVWEQMNDIYYDSATNVAKYPTLHRIFKFHGIYYAHVVMSCCNEPVTNGMADLFRIFTNALSVCIERRWESRMSCIHPYDSFLLDLLEGRISGLQETSSRASYTGLPIAGSFRIMQIVRDGKQDAPLGKMMKAFAESCPRAKFLNYDDTIAVFLHSHSPATGSAIVPDELEAFLDKYSALCGISMEFDRLADTAPHFRQARLAIKYGRALSEAPGPDGLPYDHGGKRIFLADELFPYFFLGGEKDLAELWHTSDMHSRLSRLVSRDEQRGSDDVRLLWTYMICERRLTDTASALCMHRNSVLYRIRRIEEYMGISLDDAVTRENLRLSFALAWLHGFKMPLAGRSRKTAAVTGLPYLRVEGSTQG